MRLIDPELTEFAELLAEEVELAEQRSLEAELEDAVRLEFEALQFDMAHDAKTEASMRRRLRSRYQAHVRTIPGHLPNSPGPDALALIDGKLYVVDNKGGKETRVGTDARGGAGGLSALALANTLPALVTRLERSKDPKDKAMLAKVKKTLAAAKRVVSREEAKYKRHRKAVRQAAMATARMPAMRDVKLMVTNAGGKSKGVGADLRRLGVEHLDIAGRKVAPLPAELAW